ncbi:uncharacterized protein [Malus domestica]|uniref:uncharacterized protein n=1 Tax=Malus domestica TaxID=3750 RepID=UPI0039764A40
MRNGELVEERLDRGLINKKWQDLWPNSTAIHGTVLGSDHCPVIIKTELDGKKGRKLFRFEAFWAKEDDCRKLVENCWARPNCGDVQRRWVKKIYDCRSLLIKWSRNKFKKKRRLQIEELLGQLGELQMNWSTNVSEIKEKSKLIDTMWAQEESFWHQRSRVKWLWEGDANTKFFHQSTLQRRGRNMILKLKDGEDSWVENPTQIRKLVDNHFLNVFKSGGPRD